MLKMPASGILASLPRTVNRGLVSELRPCLGEGASRRARVGRVRSLALLNILREYSFIVHS